MAQPTQVDAFRLADGNSYTMEFPDQPLERTILNSMYGAFRKAFAIPKGIGCSPINRSDVVLDLGAHLGAFTLPAAKAGARVWAIEPVPLNAKLLKRNVRKANLSKRVDVWEEAVAVGECFTFVVSEGNSTNHGFRTSNSRFRGDVLEVQQVSLRELMASVQPTVVKMDLEGAEWSILPEPLLHTARMLLLEFHVQKPKPFDTRQRVGQLLEIRQTLEAAGFKIWNRAPKPTSVVWGAKVFAYKEW